MGTHEAEQQALRLVLYHLKLKLSFSNSFIVRNNIRKFMTTNSIFVSQFSESSPVLVPRRSQSEIDINDRDHIRALTQKADGSSEVGEFYTATGADGMSQR